MKTNLLKIAIITLGILTFTAASGFGENSPVTQLIIEDAVICQDVVDRTPIGSGEVFAKEVSKLFCFTKVTGALSNTNITHNWYHKGILKASIILPVKSKSWRTYSSKRIVPEFKGEWMVEIISPNGVALESIIFFIR